MSNYKLLVNGKLVEGTSTLDVINPATGRILTAAPRADQAQLEKAVAAAKTAFPDWSAKPLRERGALLVKLAEALEAEQSTFARLLTEEQGKPLPVLRYSDIDDVIARVNDTDFGLGGSVWSSDLGRAFDVAARINAGTVWVNKHLDMGSDTPVGGAKQSGIGVEMGREGLDEFTQVAIINVAK